MLKCVLFILFTSTAFSYCDFCNEEGCFGDATPKQVFYDWVMHLEKRINLQEEKIEILEKKIEQIQLKDRFIGN